MISHKEIETVQLTDLTLHELAKSTPSYTAERFEAFMHDISKNGQTDAVIVYRSKIVDGRHRYYALKQLGIENIKIERLPHSLTINELKRIVNSKEMRRHETKAQQAIYAYKQMRILQDSGESVTQEQIAKEYGVSVRELGRVFKIVGNKKGQFNRPDLIEKLFNGEKVNIGEGSVPFLTDSLQSIINWLGKSYAKAAEDTTGLTERVLLSDEEELFINQVINRIESESKLVRQELVARIYSQLKDEERAR